MSIRLARSHCGPFAWTSALFVLSAIPLQNASAASIGGGGSTVFGIPGTVSSATSALSYTCVANGTTENAGPIQSTSPATTSCDVSAHAPNGQVVQAVGTAYTSFGLSPEADVSVEATSTGGSSPGGASSSVTMIAAVSYGVKIVGTGAAAPSVLASIPVSVSWNGSVTGTGQSSYGEACFVFSGNGSSCATPGSMNANVQLGEQYGIELHVDWFAEAGIGYAGNCQALVDPVFSFNQTAFDALMGSKTFPLAQYYEFSISPNLAVPEPSVFPLMLAGLGVLGVAARAHNWQTNGRSSTPRSS